ncbi:MAG: YceI family protein [Verrucomicrobiota bacterium]
MKPNTLTSHIPNLKITLATLLLGAASLALTAAEDAPVRYDAQPGGSTCSMDGTSTMHDWTMTTAIISGYIEADANFPESALTNTAAASPKVVANLPVRAFKSGKAKMDEKMQEHMQTDKFGRIEYRLLSLKPKSKAGAAGPLEFDAVGTLTIVGKTVTNTMPVTIEKKDGKLKVVGSTPLKMTDYGLKAPVISLLGIPTISVGDDLKIKFEWALAPKKKTP